MNKEELKIANGIQKDIVTLEARMKNMDSDSFSISVGSSYIKKGDLFEILKKIIKAHRESRLYKLRKQFENL